MIDNKNAEFKRYMHRGRRALTEDHPARALEHFGKAIEIRPKNFGVWISSARAFLMLDLFTECESAITKAQQFANGQSQLLSACRDLEFGLAARITQKQDSFVPADHDYIEVGTEGQFARIPIDGDFCEFSTPSDHRQLKTITELEQCIRDYGRIRVHFPLTPGGMVSGMASLSRKEMANRRLVAAMRVVEPILSKHWEDIFYFLDVLPEDRHRLLLGDHLATLRIIAEEDALEEGCSFQLMFKVG